MRRIAILLRRLDLLDWLVVAILVACFVSLGWNRAHEVRAQGTQTLELPLKDAVSPVPPAQGAQTQWESIIPGGVTSSCVAPDGNHHWKVVPCDYVITKAPVFDETPQEWATYEWETPSSENDLIYYLPVLTEVKHVGCVDPRRVLLSSEDGKKHCYSFYSLAATANPDAEK